MDKILIEVDGRKYTEAQMREAIRERNSLQDEVKKLVAPRNCSHDPKFAGGACAACHAILIEATEKAEIEADVNHQQVMALIGEAGRRLCEHAKCTNHGQKGCPMLSLHGWLLTEMRDKKAFTGKPRDWCVECQGMKQLRSSGAMLPCLGCGGSGKRAEKGPFHQNYEIVECDNCSEKTYRMAKLEDPSHEFMCHFCIKRHTEKPTQVMKVITQVIEGVEYMRITGEDAADHDSDECPGGTVWYRTKLDRDLKHGVFPENFRRCPKCLTTHLYHEYGVDTGWTSCFACHVRYYDIDWTIPMENLFPDPDVRDMVNEMCSSSKYQLKSAIVDMVRAVQSLWKEKHGSLEGIDDFFNYHYTSQLLWDLGLDHLVEK